MPVSTRTSGFLPGGLPGQSAAPKPKGLLADSHWLDKAAISTMLFPGVGDAVGLLADARMFAQEPESRTITNGLLSATSLLPFIPHAGMVKAFHGTPHKVDKFSMDKIGTGEGAQAYGHGLYFAENPDVAGSYKNVNTEMFLDGRPFNVDSHDGFEGLDNLAVLALRARNGNVDEAIKYAETLDPSIANQLRKMDRSRLQVEQGNLYNVNLNVEPEDLLDWDAPLSEQPWHKNRDIDALVKRVNDAGRSPTKAEKLDALIADPNSTLHKMTGQQLYHSYAQKYGSQEAASQALKEAGIPGIKYLDGNSRSAGEGTRNFVIFDDSLIEIVDK